MVEQRPLGAIKVMGERVRMATSELYVGDEPGGGGGGGDSTASRLFQIQATTLQAYANRFVTRLRNGDLSEDCIKDSVNLGITPDQWADALNSKMAGERNDLGGWKPVDVGGHGGRDGDEPGDATLGVL